MNKMGSKVEPLEGGSLFLDERLDYLPKITIVTPVYNSERYLDETIQSVVLQKYPNLEYIVVDGCSTDGSIERIKKYSKNIYSLIREPDNGQYHAINKGFSAATGDVLCWLNSDDKLAPDSLWAVASIFAQFKGKLHWISGIPTLLNSEGKLCRVSAPRTYLPKLLVLGAYEGRCLGWIQQESTFWTRNLWEKVGGRLDDSLQYAADFDLWMRFARHAELYSVLTMLGEFRVHSMQKTYHKDAYYAELDSVLKRYCVNSFIRALFTIRPIKHHLERFMLRLDGKKRFILYNPVFGKWEINQ